MAKTLEQARETGTISSYSADEAIGIVVNQLMFRKGVTRRRLGAELGVAGPNVGLKLRGETKWTITDLYNVAKFFNVDVTDLLPSRLPEEVLGNSEEFAAAGFYPSPAAYAGTLERARQDSNLQPTD